jgi:hypothetical protein
MNEKDNNRNHDGVILREALARRAKRRPVMPKDLNVRLLERADVQGHKPLSFYLPWIYGAACVVACVVAVFTLYESQDAGSPLLAKAETEEAVPMVVDSAAFSVTDTDGEGKVDEATSSEPEVKGTEPYAPFMAKAVAPSKPKSKPVEVAGVERTSVVADDVKIANSMVAENPALEVSQDIKMVVGPEIFREPEIVSCADAEEDSLRYDASKVDEFIIKLAANFDVKSEMLDVEACSNGNIANSVYVFPDSKNVDVMGRLFQIAFMYGNDLPGYKLHVTKEQFLFELDDEKKGTRHMWFVEKIKNHTLLYCAAAPVDGAVSTKCYFDFKEKFMKKNSVGYIL